MDIDVGGVRLNYILEGPPAAPVITFSNSLMTDLSLWDWQAQTLKARFRVLRYDIRGHGRSDASAPPYCFDTLLGDILAIWDALDIARSHVVGLSIGGMTALGLALAASERLASLTLCSMRADAPQAFRESWNPRIATAMAEGMSALAKPTVDRWFSLDFTDADIRARVEAMVAATAVDGFVGGAQAIQTLDYLPQVRSLRVPTLLLAGSQDGVLPAAMQDLAAEIAGARYHELNGAGHLINLERPAEVTEAIEQFIVSHSD